VFCIGRNYADHVREMGGDPKADPPVFFTKPADAVVESGSVIPYALGTSNLHFEGELVVALKQGGSCLASAQEAAELVFGHACGCDLTRRDLQAAAKNAGGPWDSAKAFDDSAPIGPIAPLTPQSAEELSTARLRLSVNGEERQNAALGSMIWTVPEILIELSKLFRLEAGDLVFTGTPEGVGALVAGDAVTVEIGALPPLNFSLA
jgi:fumarylpyruvate hydrolase